VLLTEALSAYDELKRKVQALRSLGTHPVSEVNMLMDLRTALEGALRYTELELHVSRVEHRHSFGWLANSWADNVEASAPDADKDA
jgi:hypothetical protein